MTFTYTKITESDGDEEYGDDFEYEVDDERVENEVCDLVAEEYFKIISFSNTEYEKFIKCLEHFINDDNGTLWEQLKDQFRDQLKDIFKQEAFDSLK